MSAEPEGNDRMLFMTAVAVERSREIIERAWRLKVLEHPEAVKLRWELKEALTRAEELERRAQHATVNAVKPMD